MYGFDYAYEPAYEASGFFSAVRELISNTREKIRDFMEKVKTKLKRLVKDKDQISDDSSRAIELTSKIGERITDLLNTCSKLISELYDVYERTADPSQKTVGEGDNKHIDISRAGGMDRWKVAKDSDGKEDKAKSAQWERAKIALGREFAEQGRAADVIAKDLKELNSMGTLSYKATSQGYDKLRAVFNANDDVGKSWKEVEVAANWATGAIKESLNKVVSLYKVGVKATNAFGNRLISGNYRDDSGEKLDKEDRKAKMNADKNMVKIHRENKDQFNISSKAKDIKENKSGDYRKYDTHYSDASYYDEGEGGKQSLRGSLRYQSKEKSNENVGYILDRLYQVAYEDAMHEFDRRDEYLAAYESVPGAFEFVDDDDFDLFD